MGDRSRKTVQKQIILDTLQSINTHPSVDELYAEIQKSHPSISKATVYRNMRQLAEKNVVLQIAVANDVVRYDGCTAFHHHFICNDCRRVFDIYIDHADDSKQLGTIIQSKYRYKVDRCMTSFMGTCLECIETS